MRRRYAAFFCEKCGKVRRFGERHFDHREHIIFTILTCGLWGIVWWRRYHRETQLPWVCSACHTPQMRMEEPSEVKALRESKGHTDVRAVTPRQNT